MLDAGASQRSPPGVKTVRVNAFFDVGVQRRHFVLSQIRFVTWQGHDWPISTRISTRMSNVGTGICLASVRKKNGVLRV